MLREGARMKTLVTGGSGHVGAAVVEELEAAGHDVAVFDLKPPRAGKARFIEGSVTEPASIEAAAAGMDALVHLAAIPAFRPEIAPSEFMRVNVTGTFNVLEAAGKGGVKKVVFASSDSALGFVFRTRPFSPEYFPIDEKHPLRPQDPYGLSKLLGEEICQAATRKYGITTFCLRFCWVWFEDTFAQRPAVLEGDPHTLAQTLWGYAGVRDAAQACRCAIECDMPFGDENAFFITAPDTYAEASSLELIRTYYPGVRRIADAYLHEKHKSLFDITKARVFLGYSPRQSCR